MPCYKTLSLDAAIIGEYPIHEAAYVPAPVDKIFGVLGPYVVQFNATTGAYEDKVRIAAGIYGPMRICYHPTTDRLYVSARYGTGRLQASVAQPLHDIFPVVPSTLLVQAGLQTYGWVDSNGSLYDSCAGPDWMVPVGNRLLFWDRYEEIGEVDWIDVTDPYVTYGIGDGTSGVFLSGNGGTDGTSLYFTCEGYGGVQKFANDGSRTDYNPNTYKAVSTDFCTGHPTKPLPYSVCGTKNLVRSNADWSSEDVFDLEAVHVDAAGADPFRIRYRASDSKLYIPCPNPEGVIVWDPATETGTWKGGFSNPIDIVFTSSKAFAVQESQEGLKEIV